MNLEGKDEELLRKYLLGELSEPDQQALEERLLTDDESFELLLAEEDELVDDYLGGELSEVEREAFNSYFLSTPERQRKLSFGEALKRYEPHVVPKPASEDPDDHTTGKGSFDDFPPDLLAKPGNYYPEKGLDASPIVAPSPTWWSRAASSQYLRIAAVVVIVVGVGLGVWLIIPSESDVDRGMAALSRAYPACPIETRISELNYPPSTMLRGGSRVEEDKVALNRAERLILDAVQEDPVPKSYHALGRLYLAEGKFSEAVPQFEKALETDPSNAKLHNDYGAALVEIGKLSQTNGEKGRAYYEFGQSNEHLSKALELDSALLEALFNRALCHEYMLLYREAENDWKQYIDKDPDSKWTGEARARLRELEDRPRQTSQDREQILRKFAETQQAKDDAEGWRLISESREPTGSFIENKLIDAYLNLSNRGQKDKANHALDTLLFAARLENQHALDPFLGQLVRFYELSTRSRLDGVLQARGFVKSGHASAAGNKFDEALEFFSKGKQAFEAAGDVQEAMVAAYSMGNCYLQQSKAELALTFYQPLVQACEKARYGMLLSQTLCQIANAHLYLRDFSAAFDNSERSMNLSKEMGDPKSYVGTLLQLAEEHRFVNKVRRALDLHVESLNLAHAYLPRPAELWRSYFTISLTLYQLGLNSTAIDFQKEALYLAGEAGRPRLVCRSANYLGMLMARQGKYAEATANIERALEIGSSFKEKEVRTEARAPSFLQLGYVYRKLGDFDRAVENYDQAIQAYDELDSKFFDYTARKEKLLCCMEQGVCDSVDQEMEALLKLFEEHRSKILEESNRISYFDAEQSIYDVAIEFEYSKKHNPAKAFEYSERSRGRSARDMMNPNVEVIHGSNGPDLKFPDTSEPMSLEDIQSDMPSGAQILQYSVLKNNILIWIVTGPEREPYTTSQSIATADLNKRVETFREHIVGASDDFESFSSDAADLYDLLIGPVEAEIDRSRPLCIVPDKALNNLPFAALKSRASGEYFIQRQNRGFVLSPSSTMFVTCSQAARQKETSEIEKVVSVGDPLYDRVKFSRLDELRSALREANTIARVYGSFALIGASATKSRVMNEMEKSEVIHLATHAITDELYPLCSKLLLARDISSPQGDNTDGVLQAYEILKLHLDRAKLVVLSACRSGVENYYGGEGMVGLARPFIAKRIPLVVASLWEVESGPTADLMISFHEHRKRDGHPTAEALRQAQLDMLGSENSKNNLPRCWASFVAIGGYTSF